MTKKVQSLLNELKKETLRYKELLDERTKKLTSLKKQIDHERAKIRMTLISVQKSCQLDWLITFSI